VAALAYVLLPVTGLIAYVKGSRVRTRLHGLQAIVLGLVWPAALYAASTVSPGGTQLVFVVGAVVWLFLVVAVALGRDPVLPGLGRLLRWAAASGPADRSSGSAGETHAARRRG
jgi:uncharacterized membrane protein